MAFDANCDAISGSRLALWRSGEQTLRATCISALGRWEGRLSYIDPDTGRRKRVSAYGPTQKAALAELGKIRDRMEEGKPPKDATVTVAAWMARWRETTLAASERKPATQELYSNLSQKHIEPAPFGAVRLDRLKPSDVEALILHMKSAITATPSPVLALWMAKPAAASWE
jgi:hypothetical protein